MFPLLAQIPAPASGSIENWLLSAAAVASMAVLAKKIFARKPSEPEFVTKTEFHQEMKEVREKIEAGFLTTRDTIDQAKGYLILSAERQADSIHLRLNNLESGLARLEERTKD